MNALIYLRVSTKEQAAKDETAEGYSIPGQREACLRLISEKGWNVADEFVDAGESARSSDRPSLKAMLARVAEDEIGAVVVHKIDRLARNIEDHVAIRASLRKAGVALISVTENIEETASGKLVEGIHALMAELYSANLASEIRKGMTQKAKMGGWPQRAPIGYLNNGEKVAGQDIAKVVFDPERAFLVKEMFRLYATGDYSLAELQGVMGGIYLRAEGTHWDNVALAVQWHYHPLSVDEDAHIAAVLLGAAGAIRESLGLSEPYLYRDDLDQARSQCLNIMGEEAFQAALAEAAVLDSVNDVLSSFQMPHGGAGQPDPREPTANLS